MAMTGGTAKLLESHHPNYGSVSSVTISLYAYYKVSQSVANNQSTVSVGMYVSSNSTTYGIGQWDDYSHTSYIGTKSDTFDGTLAYTTFSGGPVWLAENKTFTVTHDPDGTGKATIYWKWGINSPWGGFVTPSGSFDITLPTIPRSSSITSAANITLGNACSIKWTPASTSFYYKLKFSCGGKNYTTGALNPNTTSAYTYSGYTMSIADWAPYITTSKIGTCTATLYTYSNSACSTQIGSETTKTFTLTVPSTVKPTCGNITATLVNGYQGYYVQGKSSATLAIAASSGIYSSTITNYYIGGAYTYDSTTRPTSQSTGIITSSGTKTFYAQVKDSRTYLSDQKSVSINVVPYANPTVQIQANRATTSGSINISYTLGYSPMTVTSGSTTSNLNSLASLTIYKKEYGASTWTSATTISNPSTTGTATITGCDTTKSYVFKATVTDTAYSSSTTSAEASTGTEARPFNIKSNNNGIAFGKMAETDNLMECAYNAKFNGNVSVSGDILGGGVDTLKFGTVIPQNTNLNNLTTPGNYYSPNATTSATLVNTPYTGGGFQLIVRNIQSASIVRQHVFYGRTNVIRHYNGSSWSDWLKIAMISPDVNLDDISDFVVAYGTSTVSGATWSYRKWYSGKAECWCGYSYTTNISSSSGSLYYGTSKILTYPTNLFNSAPVVNATIAGDSMVMLGVTGNGSSTQTPYFYPIRGVSTSSVSIYLKIHAISQ